MFLRNCIFLFICLHLSAGEFFIDPVPAAVIINPCPCLTIINSVDFHPKKNQCCVTYTIGNRVDVYNIDSQGKPEVVQSLINPAAHLSEPQHAVFSPDGNQIVVANWTNETFTIYQVDHIGLYSSTPFAIIPSPSNLINFKPHGIAFSPCGNFLAVAYGVSNSYGRGIALYHITKEGCVLWSLLQGTEIPGVPKGITFSPDGTCLLVTFADTNSLVIYDLDSEDHSIMSTPRQVIQGQETGISRPEDVKISPDGNTCAISNSSQQTVTFYSFNNPEPYRVGREAVVDALLLSRCHFLIRTFSNLSICSCYFNPNLPNQIICRY